MCASLALFGLAVPDANAETPREPIVFYLSRVVEKSCGDAGCEWRTFDPVTGTDQLFLRLPDPPEAVFWDEKFRTLYYKMGSSLYQVEWQRASVPTKILEFPAALDDPTEELSKVWLDGKSGAWKMSTAAYSPTGQRAKLWECVGGHWATVGEKKTRCECGDCPCASIVEPREMTNRVSLDQLLEQMRITAHLSRTGQHLSEETSYDIPTRSSANSRLRVNMEFGDSAHAIAPLALLSTSAAEPQHQYRLGCDRQLAFEDFRGFLLLGTEFSTDCAEIIDLHSGDVVRSLPEDSKWAVWVPEPAPAPEDAHAVR